MLAAVAVVRVVAGGGVVLAAVAVDRAVSGGGVVLVEGVPCGCAGGCAFFPAPLEACLLVGPTVGIGLEGVGVCEAAGWCCAKMASRAIILAR